MMKYTTCKPVAKIRLSVLLLPLLLLVSVVAHGQNTSQRSDHFAPIKWYASYEASSPHNASSSNVYGKKISLSFYGVELEDALKTIAQKVHLRLSYDKKQLENHTVTFVKNNLTVIDAFESILKGTGLEVLASPNGQIVIKQSKEADLAKVQAETVSGTVTDAQSGETLPGVNIRVKGTTTGTATDASGKYELTVESLQDTLVFSFVGYQTRQVPIQGRTTIDVEMQPQVLQGEEMVVVGYGTQKRKDLTGSISSVSGERLDNSVNPSNNIFEALKGSVPGLQISQNSSSASGGDQSILLRGRNSINADNDPLIILDGAPYSRYQSISNIPTSVIKSISVLKGPSATAIYGSRGANGVILITTKQGQGDLQITYNGSIETQKAVNIPDLLNGQEFYEFKKQRTPKNITPSEQEVYDNNEGVNWVDLALQRGIRQNHSLSFSGGSDNVNYFIAGSALLTKGTAVNDKFKRYAIRSNVKASVTDWLTLSTNSQLAVNNKDGLSADFGSARGAFYMNPLTTPFKENGELTIYPWPEYILYGNPLAATRALNMNRRYEVITDNDATINFPFLKGLQYNLNTSVQYSNINSQTYFKQSNTRQGFENQGEASNDNSSRNRYLVENVLKYNRDYGKNSLDLTGLFSYQITKRRSASIDASGFPNDIQTNYQYGQAGSIDPSTGYYRSSLLSSMLRVNYGYDSRYLITGTIRRDGYNGFGEDYKYGLFPSVALAWNISNEDFFNSGTVNNLKLRASYGTNGNQSIGVYQKLARYTARNYEFGPNLAPGYIPSQLSNPQLSWESTTTLNLGLDFGVWNDRLNGSIDVYHSETNDLLLNRTIPSVLGITDITQNIGSTRNKGIELSLSSYNIRNADFSWHTQIAASFNKNEIVSLVGKEDIKNNRLFIGEPIRVNYDYVYNGVWQLDDDIENSAQPDAKPGYVKIKDVNNDGEITADDRIIQGQRDPKYLLSMGNTFSYHNFSLYVYFQGQFGSKRFNPLTRDNVYSDTQRNTLKKNWWTPDNPTNQHWANDVDANTLNIELLQSDVFVRLKTATLSYNVAKDWLQKQGISQLKFNLTGENLYTITNWTGLDPELSGQRAVPLTRNILFGVNLSF